MKITIQQIEDLSPNAAAAKNGRDLVSRKKFANLCCDGEEALLWGECAGSGSKPYGCSADFIQPEKPTFRCTCPSRQFPCKHCIGLLYARAQGLPFTTAAVPEDIASKRQKMEKRQENKEKKAALGDAHEQGQAAKPKTLNKAALAKKIGAQLAGLELADKLLAHIVGSGLSSIDAKEMKNLRERVKDLGNYYIPGVQTAFNNLFLELEAVNADEYTRCIDQINYLTALLRKAAEYLAGRLEAPDVPPEIDSEIEEQIGRAWKLSELRELGLCENDAELAQLSFNVYDNPARREFVDEGAWINLKSGRIYKTRNYRPYRAAKYIAEENSFADVARIGALYVYPGGLNPRARWEGGALGRRPLERADLETIRSRAVADYAACAKEIKNAIKNPLADKNPLALIALREASLLNGNLLLRDPAGNCLTLRDLPQDIHGGEQQAATMLKSILPAGCAGLCLLVMACNNVSEGLFTALPMTLITPDKLIKLFW